MTFYAEYRQNVLFWMLTAIGIFGVSVGMKSFDWGFILVGAIFILFPLLVRLRFKVKVTPDYLESSNFIRTKRIYWNAILDVRLKAEDDFWSSRCFGPFTYAFCGKDKQILINFKLFSRECLRTVFDKVKEVGIKN